MVLICSLIPPSHIQLLPKLPEAPCYIRKGHRLVSGLSQNYTSLSLGVARGSLEECNEPFFCLSLPSPLRPTGLGAPKMQL